MVWKEEPFVRTQQRAGRHLDLETESWSSMSTKFLSKMVWKDLTADDARDDRPFPKTRPARSLHCDYDQNCIQLYHKIELQHWDDVKVFLDTGSWPGFSPVPECVGPRFQAMTKVTKYNHAKGKPEEILWQRLPLQRACMLNPPFGVIRRLVNIYPESVRWKNIHGQLALHLAMLCVAPDDVVAFLVSRYPASINAETTRGFTPLQAAVKSKSPARGLMIAVFADCISQQHPAANTTIPDRSFHCEYDETESKELVLFKKLENKEWGAVVEFLDTGRWVDRTSIMEYMFPSKTPAKVNPKQEARTWVTHRDHIFGSEQWTRLPLHGAIVIGAPFCVTRRLIELHPESVRYTDDQGMLPIHLAFLHNADNDVVAKLLLEYPESVNQKSKLALTPLDCALRAKNIARGKILELFLTDMSAQETVVTMKTNRSEWAKQKDQQKTMSKKHSGTGTTKRR